MADLYTFFIKWFLDKCSTFNQWAQSPCHNGQRKLRRGEDWALINPSFHFQDPPPPPHPPHWPAPSQSAQEETGGGGSHPSNQSHHGHGSAPLRGTAAQTSFVPCCQLSRLASAKSMGSDVMVVIIHPSRLIQICVFMLGERTKVSASNMPHAQSGVISTQRFFVHYNKQCEWECVGGGQGTNHTPLRSVYRTLMIILFQVPQTNNI